VLKLIDTVVDNPSGEFADDCEFASSLYTREPYEGAPACAPIFDLHGKTYPYFLYTRKPNEDARTQASLV